MTNDTPSKRAQAANAYFATDRFIEEAADKIRQDIIEHGRSWTNISVSIPDGGLDSHFGSVATDAPHLRNVEAALKAKFNQVNHLRFDLHCSFPTVVIDTKPNTWLRRTFTHPERSCGFG